MIRKLTRQCGTDLQLSLTQESDVYKNSCEHFLKETKGMKVIWKQDLDLKAQGKDSDRATIAGTQAKAAMEVNERDAAAREALQKAEAQNRGVVIETMG